MKMTHLNGVSFLGSCLVCCIRFSNLSGIFFFSNQIVQLGFFFLLLLFPSFYSLPYFFGVFVFIGFSSELAVDLDENDLSFFEFSLLQKSDSFAEFLYFDSWCVTFFFCIAFPFESLFSLAFLCGLSFGGFSNQILPLSWVSLLWFLMFQCFHWLSFFFGVLFSLVFLYSFLVFDELLWRCQIFIWNFGSF